MSHWPLVISGFLSGTAFGFTARGWVTEWFNRRNRKP